MGNFNMLPEDVMLNILTRLPAESVLECKLVSKCFPKMHLNHLDAAPDSGKLGFTLYTKGFDKEPIYYTEYDENSNCFRRTRKINLGPPFDDCYILDSINGLICFNGSRHNSYLQFEPAYICNPITREYIVVPKFETDGLLTGFGYSPSTNQYKVVRICDNRGLSDTTVVQVYTLGSGNGWRNVSKLDSDDVRCTMRQYGASVDGAIHWVDFDGSILAFDLATEEFRNIPLTGRPAGRVLVLGDSLCAYNYYAGWFEIGVLKKNANDVIWSKKFLIMDAKPISFTKSGGLLCHYQPDTKVYCYAPEACTSRILVNFDKDINFNSGVSHKNTLVSLKALGEEDTKLMDSGARARSCKEAESSGQ